MSRLRAIALLLLVIAAGTLGASVIVSTAAGIETQVFVLVYLVGFGFALDEARHAIAYRWTWTETEPWARN